MEIIFFFYTFVTLNSGVALIARQTFTNHSTNRFSIEYFALGVDATRVGGVAGLDAGAVNTGGTRWTLPVAFTACLFCKYLFNYKFYQIQI